MGNTVFQERVITASVATGGLGLTVTVSKALELL